jgi:uncharacterized protein
MTENKPAFIDASGWIAILSLDDEFHARALDLWEEFSRTQRRLISTDWVFAEAGNGLARTRLRADFVAAVRLFLQSSQCVLFRMNGELFEMALDLYSRRKDKNWGLVDCSSFIVMRDQGITEAVTADKHFKQADFRCLLLEPNK